MKDYHINIYFSEPDDGYVADIPDLSIYSPPVKTPAEALTAIEQAKKQWLESATAEQRPIPEPRYRSDTYNPAKQKNDGHPAEAKPLSCLFLCNMFRSVTRLHPKYSSYLSRMTRQQGEDWERACRLVQCRGVEKSRRRPPAP